MAEEKTAPLAARVPIPLMEKIAEAAKENVRSVTGEVIFRLEKSFKDEPNRAG